MTQLAKMEGSCLCYEFSTRFVTSLFPWQVQEQFQQQLHEQQQKIQLLQAVVEKQKAQIEKKEEPELPNIPLDQLGQEGMSHDAIKMAFSKLQVGFSLTCVTPTLSLCLRALTSRKASHANMLKLSRHFLGFVDDGAPP